jgi:hypothetical protein
MELLASDDLRLPKNPQIDILYIIGHRFYRFLVLWCFRILLVPLVPFGAFGPLASPWIRSAPIGPFGLWPLVPSAPLACSDPLVSPLRPLCPIGSIGSFGSLDCQEKLTTCRTAAQCQEKLTIESIGAS